MAGEPIRIVLRGTPQGKGRPRFVRATGRAYTPAKTRSYESDLRLAAQDAMGARPPIAGPVRVDIRASLPIPPSWSKSKRAGAALNLIRPTSRPDADNFLKATADALNSVVWRDDAQIVEATVTKRYSDTPALEVIVRELGEAAP